MWSEQLEEQLAEGQPEHLEQLEERQPGQLAVPEQMTENKEPEQLEERRQTGQMVDRLTGQLAEQVIEGKPDQELLSLEQLVGQPEQLGTERQPEQQPVERSQPAGREQPMAVERQFKQPARPLEERLYIEEGKPKKQMKYKGLNGRLTKGNRLEQKMEILPEPRRTQNYRQIEGPVQIQKWKQLNQSWLLELMVNLCSTKVWGVFLSIIAHNGANVGVT